MTRVRVPVLTQGLEPRVVGGKNETTLANEKNIISDTILVKYVRSPTHSVLMKPIINVNYNLLNTQLLRSSNILTSKDVYHVSQTM